MCWPALTTAAAQARGGVIEDGEVLHPAPSHSIVTLWDMVTSCWEAMPSAGTWAPSERYGHSVVIHYGALFMYGGIIGKGHISKELWSFHLGTQEWRWETPKTGQCLGSLCGEIHSAGHTATMVQNRMLIIFGYRPQYGYLDTAQVYLVILVNFNSFAVPDPAMLE